MPAGIPQLTMKTLSPSRAALALIRDAAVRDGSNNTTTTFICTACRAHAIRTLHTTRPVAVAGGSDRDVSERSTDSFLERMRKRFRPMEKEEQERALRREEQRRTDLLRRAEAQQTYGNDLETFVAGDHDYEIAHVVDKSLHPDYVPAKTWDGLARIGDEGYVKRLRDRGEVYQGFAPPHHLKLSDTQWDNLLHSISVEILALQHADRETADLFTSHGNATRWARTQSVVIVPGKDGGNATLSFETPTLNEEVLAAIPEGPDKGAQGLAAAPEDDNEEAEGLAAAPEAAGEAPEALAAVPEGASEESKDLAATSEGAGEAEALEDTVSEDAIKAADEQADFANVISSGVLDLDQSETTRDVSQWSRINLDNVVKLALTKRITQLTSKRLPDPIISQTKTLLDLRNALVRPDRATKLRDSPALQPSVFADAGVSNVSISHKRGTMQQKEKSIGRWKVIVDELKQRDIPVAGTRYKGMKVKPVARRASDVAMPIRRREKGLEASLLVEEEEEEEGGL